MAEESKGERVPGSAEKSGQKRDGEHQVALHPLAIITMSDHYTRVSTGGGVPAPTSKILGILFGVQQGLEVSIFDATEVSYSVTNGRIVVDQQSVDKQKELYSAVYPTYEVLGWYSVGDEPNDVDIEIHKQMERYNESPLFVVLNPAAAVGGKDLPVSVHEGEVHTVNDQTHSFFVPRQFQLQTAQAEQISVEHVARATPMSGASTIDRHAATMTTTLKTLSNRVTVLQSYLSSVKAGTVAPDYRVLRQIASITNELKARGEAFDHEYAREYSDSLMVGCLAATLKNAALVEDMVARFAHAASDRKARSSMFT